MTVKELIEKLKKYNMEQEVRICCYTSIGDDKEMVIYGDLMDKNGNTPIQVDKEITYVGLETDSKTVCIS